MQRLLFSARRTFLTTTALLATVGLAHADVKIVQKVTTDGPIPGQQLAAPDAKKPTGPTQTTTYYKGNKTRVETGDTVTITDADAATITFINLKKKTYSTVKIADLMRGVELPPFLEMMSVKVKADVKPGGHEKEIAGKKATDYLWTATMSMLMGADEKGEGGNEVATVTIESEEWTTTAIPEPVKIKDLPQGAASMGNAGAGMAGMMNRMKGASVLQEKLAAVKGFRLTSSIKTSVESPFAQQQGMDLSKPMVSKTEVVSLDESPLADDLFAPPADFKKVPYEAPKLAIPGAG